MNKKMIGLEGLYDLISQQSCNNTPQICGTFAYKNAEGQWESKIDYFCSYCTKKDCEHWYKYNRVLDDWIKPFVDSVNERFRQCG